MSYERPSSPYADRILTTHWPQQSEYAWKTFADELTAEFGRLLEQESSQLSIMRQMHDQSSAGLIPAINQLIANRNGTLAARVKAVQIARPIAEAVQSAIISLKADLYWIVETAAQQIKEAEARCAGIGKAAALEGEIQAIIAAAQIEANDADALRSGEAAAHTAKLSEWTPASIRDGDGSGAATPLSTGTVVGGGGAYNAPLSPGNGNGVKAVDYNTMKEGTAADAAHGEAKTAEKPTLSDQARDAAWKPNSLDPKDTATKPNPDKPGMPAQSSPSGGSPASSGGSGGSSVLGSMIRPMTSSPAASPAGRGFSPGGSPAAASPAAAHGGAPGGAPAGAGASSGGGAPGARAASVAGTGSGIAESGARMGAGTVNAAANALGTAGNVGSQVAQGAAAATQSGGPAAAPPAAVSAPVSGAPAGGPPMAMMPPAGGVAAAGPAPVNGSDRKSVV